MFPHPAADTKIDGQRLADDFIAVFTGTATVGIGCLVLVENRYQQGFCIYDVQCSLRDRGENPLQIEFAGDQIEGILQQVYFRFTLLQLAAQALDLLIILHHLNYAVSAFMSRDV